MASKTTYEVHRLTGSQLIDGDGRTYGNESAGRTSWHKTRKAAEIKVYDLRHACPLSGPWEIREVCEGKVVACHPPGAVC